MLITLQDSAYECLMEFKEAAQDEVKAFCDLVARVKLACPSTHECNTGTLFGPRLNIRYNSDVTVKVTIAGDLLPEPYVFTPTSKSVESR